MRCKWWRSGDLQAEEPGLAPVPLSFLSGDSKIVLPRGQPVDVLARQREGAFFWNRQDGMFRDISQASGLGEPGRVRNVSVADIDGDGFVDVFMNNHPDRGLGPFKSNGAFWLYHNNASSMGNANHWIKVTVEGTGSNLDGIGTRIWARDRNKLVQMRDINSGATHGGGDERAAYFGLGTQTVVDVRIRWPTGVVQWLEGMAVDQHIHVVEP